MDQIDLRWIRNSDDSVKIGKTENKIGFKEKAKDQKMYMKELVYSVRDSDVGAPS